MWRRVWRAEPAAGPEHHNSQQSLKFSADTPPGAAKSVAVTPTVSYVVTGLIYAAIVVLWAAYLVPLALRRYDEASRDRSVEAHSPRMLRRRRGESDAAPEPAEPARPAVERSESVTESTRREPVQREAAQPDVQRESTRVAVRRRRRTLLTLLFATTVVAALGYAAVVPWWTVAVPAGLVVAWLVACRLQVLGELADAAPQTMGDAPDDEPTIVISGQLEDYEPGRRNIMLDEPLGDADLDQQVSVAVPFSTTEGGSLWDPVPVTLPTYVDQPRAARTVRTIDFNDPDAWTSGRVDGEQTELDTDRADDAPQRRAVGD